jgi:parallel beta-helix repeat protein
MAAGTYAEQVTIARTLKLVGAGAKSVIKAPAVMVPDPDGFLNIVEIRGGATVTGNDFTVAGPGPGPCHSISSGIAIIGGALLDIDDVFVRDIRDEPLSNCGRVYGIRAGTQSGGPPDVGHLIATHCTVTGYQNGGILVYGPGSTGQISQNKVQGTTPNNKGFSNGIWIFDGALGTINRNTSTGNQCSAPTCGPEWFGQIQSFGIVLTGANPGTTVSNNIVYGNDGGIDADNGGDIDHNNASDNLDFGLVLDVGYAGNAHDNTANGMNASCPAGSTSCDGILVLSSGATVGNNTVRNNGHNGIEVGAGGVPAVGNTLKDNTLTGNASFDANDHTSGSGTAGTGNTWYKNHCTTSSPSGLCS